MADEIKTMQLYNHIDRIFNELKEMGIQDANPLDVERLSEVVLLLDMPLPSRGHNFTLQLTNDENRTGDNPRITSRTSTNNFLGGSAYEMQKDQTRHQHGYVVRCLANIQPVAREPSRVYRSPGVHNVRCIECMECSANHLSFRLLRSEAADVFSRRLKSASKAVNERAPQGRASRRKTTRLPHFFCPPRTLFEPRIVMGVSCSHSLERIALNMLAQVETSTRRSPFLRGVCQLIGHGGMG